MDANNYTYVHDFLEQSACLFPEKEALVHEQDRYSYIEINTMANNLANWMLDQGIGAGDRVVVVLENSFHYVVSYYAVLKVGAVFVSLSTDIKPDGIRPLLSELEPQLLISNSRFERMLLETGLDESGLQRLLLVNSKQEWNLNGTVLHMWDAIPLQDECDNLAASVGENDLAAIIYTSGSTGKPKGVMLSHKNIVTNTCSICEYLELTADDRQMAVLPFFYVMGKSLLNTHFAVSGTVIINNKFAFPATVVKQMVEEKVTGMSGVPSTYAYLLHRSPLAKSKEQLSSLRYVSQAGGHMSSQIKQELIKILPEHTRIFIMYGATEASARLTWLEPEKLEEKIESIGRPISGVTMKVLDQHGNEMPPGQEGELVASGDNIMLGYYKDEESTRAVLDEHGYHTGDLGYVDEDGCFFVTGRRDNLLKVGGHRINTQEVEDAFDAAGLVVEVAVLGVPDKLAGNKLVAVVVPRDRGMEPRALLDACAEKLPKYKVPGECIIVRNLPKKASGKIDKAGCMALYEKSL